MTTSSGQQVVHSEQWAACSQQQHPSGRHTASGKQCAASSNTQAGGTQRVVSSVQPAATTKRASEIKEPKLNNWMDIVRPDRSRRRQPTCHQAKAEVKGARKLCDPGSVRQEVNQVPSASLYKVLPHSDWLGRATQLKLIIHYFILLH